MSTLVLPLWLVYSIGFVAQGFFSARILVQWFLSEKSHRVVSPSIYWIFSLAGSVLLFTYGMFRHDFSIILGQFISYYIYIWNLNIKGVWSHVGRIFRGLILLLPVVALCYLLRDAGSFFTCYFHNDAVPLPLLLFGSTGQVLFSIRFIYQWYISYRQHQSVLPVGFWVFSLVGSGIIVSYGIFRLDPVLIIGQSVGFIAYARNIVISKKAKAL